MVIVFAIVFTILHVLELIGIGFFFYEWWTVGLSPLKNEFRHGVCTMCDKKVARWARPGVCVNCAKIQ